MCLATTTCILGASSPTWAQAAAAFDDADAQLRVRQASTAAAEAAAAVDRLRKALAAERGKVLGSDAERDLNRETIAGLEKNLRDAETRQRDTDKALKDAQEARNRGLAGEAERRKLEAARPATPAPQATTTAAPPAPSPAPAPPRPAAAAPAPLPPLAPLPPNTAGWIADARTGCRIWSAVPEGGTVSWSGPCPNGVAHGRGVLQWFKNGQPINRRYEGERRNGKAHGPGVLVTETGARYEGESRDGTFNGRATLTLANGDRYDGEWLNSKFHGRGTFAWADGRRYEGEWRDNRPNGLGTLKKPDGTYSGTWTNGCFQQGNRRQMINASAKECGFAN